MAHRASRFDGRGSHKIETVAGLQLHQSRNLVYWNSHCALAGRNSSNQACARAVRLKIGLGKDIIRRLVVIRDAADDGIEAAEHIGRDLVRPEIDEREAARDGIPQMIARHFSKRRDAHGGHRYRNQPAVVGNPGAAKPSYGIHDTGQPEAYKSSRNRDGSE